MHYVVNQVNKLICNIKLIIFSVVLNSLRYLCTKTDILAHPEKLPEEARQAVMSTLPVYP